MKENGGKILLYFFSIVILISLLLYGGISEIVSELKKLDIITVAILLILTGIYTLLRTYRFLFLLNQKYKIGFFSLFPIYIYGIGLSNIVPGRFSEPIRALLLKTEKRISFTFSMACVFFERLSDMLILIFLSIFVLFSFNQTIFSLFSIPFFVIFAIVLLSIFATQYKPAYDFFLLLLLKFLDLVKKFLKFFGLRDVDKKFGRIIWEIKKLIKILYSELKLSKVFIHPLFISLLIWVIDGLTFYIPLRVMGYEIDFILVLSAYSLSLLIGLITFLPGGFGSMELAMTIILTTFGIDKASAVTSVLIGRFFGLGIIIIGSIFAPHFIKKEKIVLKLER